MIKIWVESSHTLTVGCIFWCAYKETTEHWSLAPANTRICDGSALSRTEYAELFSLIGTQHGAGDGSTTFNIPNLNLRFIEGGWSSPNFPNTIGKHIEAGLPNITGEFLFNNDMGSVSPDGYTGAFKAGTRGNYWSPTGDRMANNYRIGFSASGSNSIYGNSDTVQPNSIYLIPCIVVKSNTFVTYCFKRTV